jgi:hypothetical protein
MHAERRRATIVKKFRIAGVVEVGPDVGCKKCIVVLLISRRRGDWCLRGEEDGGASTVLDFCDRSSVNI